MLHGRDTGHFYLLVFVVVTSDLVARADCSADVGDNVFVVIITRLTRNSPTTRYQSPKPFEF